MIRRRELLAGVAAAGAAALASGALVPACAREDPLERALRGFFADRDAAREVGAELLAQGPDPAEPRVLVEHLARERAARLRELARSDPEGLAELLREQHRADFAADRVVLVRGWTLSRTEAGLYALAALPD
jgi:hypothetical protein